MKCLLPVLCTCAVLYFATAPVLCGQERNSAQRRHKISHLMKMKRSTTESAAASLSRSQKLQKKFHIPISSFVDDVSESTAFRDREKKLKSLATSHQGELYHANVIASKRRYVANPTKAKITDNSEDNSDDSDNDDESVATARSTTTTGSKKHSILKDNTDGKSSDKSDDMEDEVDDQSENDADDDADESGSGENEDTDSNTKTDSDDDKSNDNNDDGEEDNEDDKNATQRSGKLKCRRKCSIPLTFHKCAFPRCSGKMGTIKDLCFFLCKHQKEKCEDVCE